MNEPRFRCSARLSFLILRATFSGDKKTNYWLLKSCSHVRLPLVLKVSVCLNMLLIELKATNALKRGIMSTYQEPFFVVFPRSTKIAEINVKTCGLIQFVISACARIHSKYLPTRLVNFEYIAQFIVKCKATYHWVASLVLIWRRNRLSHKDWH